MTVEKPTGWPYCIDCRRSGVDEWGGTCLRCGGSGRDLEACEKCDQRGVGWTDDGEFLCEDCLFNQMAKGDAHV